MARRGFLAILALAFAGGLAFGAGQASANHVSCGDEITADTTLDSDLVNCPNNGIVIGADNVTLDLNGHTIDGDGFIQGGHQEDTGVSIFEHDGITVKHGSIRQFGNTGLQAIGVRDIRLLGLAASQNDRFGITVSAADRILIRNCSVNRTTAGDSAGAGLLVTQSFGPGLEEPGGARRVRIVNSSFRHNRDGIRSFGAKHGVIKGNLFSGNTATGIDWGGSRDRLMRNRLVRNGTGIVVGGSRNVIARNRVSHSRLTGVAINSGNRNLIARNVVDGAAMGIRINGEAEPGRGGPVHNVIRGNRLRRADDDGLHVDLTAKHTLLLHNSARDAEDDGFDVNDPTTKLSRNRADRNGDLGIEAVRGVIDGGGNRASGNGDPRQCVNVTCR